MKVHQVKDDDGCGRACVKKETYILEEDMKLQMRHKVRRYSAGTQKLTFAFDREELTGVKQQKVRVCTYR